MNNISNNNSKTINGDAILITHESAPAADSNLHWYKNFTRLYKIKINI